jgi:hypothetical protein
MPTPTITSSSGILEDLLSKKEWNEKALERCKKSLVSLEGYLSSLNVQHVDVTEVAKVMDNYDAVGQKLDEKVTELERIIKGIEKEIASERGRLAGPSRTNSQLTLQATTSVFAELEGDVEIVLLYGKHPKPFQTFDA